MPGIQNFMSQNPDLLLGLGQGFLQAAPTGDTGFGMQLAAQQLQQLRAQQLQREEAERQQREERARFERQFSLDERGVAVSEAGQAARVRALEAQLAAEETQKAAEAAQAEEAKNFASSVIDQFPDLTMEERFRVEMAAGSARTPEAARAAVERVIADIQDDRATSEDREKQRLSSERIASIGASRSVSPEEKLPSALALEGFKALQRRLLENQKAQAKAGEVLLPSARLPLLERLKEENADIVNQLAALGSEDIGRDFGAGTPPPAQGSPAELTESEEAAIQKIEEAEVPGLIAALKSAKDNNARIVALMSTGKFESYAEAANVLRKAGLMVGGRNEAMLDVLEN